MFEMGVQHSIIFLGSCKRVVAEVGTASCVGAAGPDGVTLHFNGKSDPHRCTFDTDSFN